MKLVIAFIKPYMLDQVLLALHELQPLSGVSITDARGFGRGRGATAETRMLQGGALTTQPRIRIEAACSSAEVDRVIEVIETNAHTGRRGDGKIYVVDLEDAVRISTGERGEAAL